MPVTVSLSNQSVTVVTVGYSTTPGSAVSPSDFLTSSGTVTIPAGQTTGTFNVTVKGDTVPEDYEYFNVVLSGPGGGASAIPNLGNATEKIQILNDEKPSLTGTAPTESEGKHAPVRCDTRPALLPTDHGHLHDCERHSFYGPRIALAIRGPCARSFSRTQFRRALLNDRQRAAYAESSAWWRIAWL